MVMIWGIALPGTIFNEINAPMRKQEALKIA